MIYFILGRSYLVIEENPEQSEAIIVLSGADGRLEHAVELYAEMGAEAMILSNSTENATTKEEALQLGIPSDIIIEEPEATSTYTNATLTKKIMQDKGYSSAIVVTSDYHSRRTRMTFEEIFKDSGIDLTYGVAPSDFSPEGDATELDTRISTSEYVKLTGYWLRLFIF
ncbi:hypothetical protein N781_18400 [Pontibacillus halophilus JSM 076056 = DSM 19796]|uniref:DUF218 domain-containing protein n=1 Tax=Pontibacillus halophilus JSM 076056 = DSM 19796 TaxID=1385510 RepID=A0A0A5GJS6_9BACI|nr:hypothetical protein N781_18400 [Pontibacillus halophilus JSM 076056 = DSM 19796]